MKTADGVEIVVGRKYWLWGDSPVPIRQEVTAAWNNPSAVVFNLQNCSVSVHPIGVYSTERAAKDARAAELRRRAAELVKEAEELERH